MEISTLRAPDPTPFKHCTVATAAAPPASLLTRLPQSAQSTLVPARQHRWHPCQLYPWPLVGHPNRSGHGGRPSALRPPWQRTLADRLMVQRSTSRLLPDVPLRRKGNGFRPHCNRALLRKRHRPVPAKPCRAVASAG